MQDQRTSIQKVEVELRLHYNIRETKVLKVSLMFKKEGCKRGELKS